MGAEKHPTVGSSGEYWSMNESLNQHDAYDERLVKVVKAMKAVKSVRGRKKMIFTCQNFGLKRCQQLR